MITFSMKFKITNYATYNYATAHIYEYKMKG